MPSAEIEFNAILSTFVIFPSPTLIVVNVPAFGLFPPTIPSISPTKFVEVIDVAPDTVPKSTLIVPSKTIAEPAAGIRLRAPDDVLIVLPSKFKLSTSKSVKVPKDVIAVCAG